MCGGGGQKKKINGCSFTAESEYEKEEWIEAVQESIAETLSDYEVAEKIWFDEANRSCADCRAPRPEWAAINLGVVICKKCAGKERTHTTHVLDADTHTVKHTVHKINNQMEPPTQNMSQNEDSNRARKEKEETKTLSCDFLLKNKVI